ncbi:MAG: hypothetical protein PHN68_03125 [Prolixibacteraceae bacterium]|jgi:hypothetical protein|nr:hypothetical protein [Prolixibacteraceae bacterium]NLO03532.1 hypothetical protein [Bacteroidales bacterium]
MPYRRLPTTDKARLRALESAIKAASGKDIEKLAFSKHTLYNLQNIKTNFENCLIHHELDVKIEADKYSEYKEAYRKAKLYISHFIQTLYMSIEREELNSEILRFYSLSDMDFKVPPLNTEEEIYEWGKKVIEGEQKRILKGGSAIYNPSIALVKVKIEDFHEAAVFQHNLKKNVLRSYSKMQEIRKKTNEFISSLWTEIEDNLGNIPPQHKRQKAQDYGIVYVFRRNEKKKLNLQGMQVDLFFEFN